MAGAHPVLALLRTVRVCEHWCKLVRSCGRVITRMRSKDRQRERERERVGERERKVCVDGDGVEDFWHQTSVS